MKEVENRGFPEDPYEEEELLIVKKITDMMEYAYLALAQFPRSEKFAMAADIKKCMNRLLERAVEANKKYYKKTTLQSMDVELAILRKYIRMAYRLKFLPYKKYRIWTEKTNEIGRMLGGWIKSTKR